MNFEIKLTVVVAFMALTELFCLCSLLRAALREAYILFGSIFF
jgi:hypothetical protein